MVKYNTEARKISLNESLLFQKISNNYSVQYPCLLSLPNTSLESPDSLNFSKAFHNVIWLSIPLQSSVPNQQNQTHSYLQNQKFWGWNPSNVCCSKASRWFQCRLEFEHYVPFMICCDSSDFSHLLCTRH